MTDKNEKMEKIVYEKLQAGLRPFFQFQVLSGGNFVEAITIEANESVTTYTQIENTLDALIKQLYDASSMYLQNETSAIVLRGMAKNPGAYRIKLIWDRPEDYPK